MFTFVAIVRRIGRFAESIPLVAYVFLFGAASVVGGQYWIAYVEDQAFQRGRADAQSQARIDSTLLKFAITAEAMRRSRTDTVIRYITRRAASVDSAASATSALARHVPLSLDTVPQVRALKASVFALEITVHTLTDSIPSLLHTIDAERASARMTQDVLGAQLTAAKIIIVAKNDTIAELEKRPRWRTVGKASVLAVVVWEGVKLIAKAVRK